MPESNVYRAEQAVTCAAGAPAGASQVPETVKKSSTLMHWLRHDISNQAADKRNSDASKA